MRLVLAAIIFSLVACSFWEDSSNEVKPLIQLAVYHTDVPEPSGLSLAQNTYLFCVSDHPDNRIYEIDRQGGILRTLDFRGNDLEGVAFDSADTTLWLVEEGLSELIHLTSQGAELSRWQLDFEIADANKGFEGIFRDTVLDEIIIVTQSDPPTILRLDADKQITTRLVIDFATDLTGICRGRAADEYLLLSHNDQKVLAWSWEKGLIESFSFNIKQAEGIDFDPETSRLYIVCDAEAKIYVFEFP